MADEGTEPQGDATEPSAAVDVDLRHQVRLETFSGPLDLLLYLVRRAEVDIADIPIADIADQFVAAIGTWSVGDPRIGDIDLEAAGDFILMAATLLEIKSRLVAPPLEDPSPEDADDDQEVFDPRSGLIRQLLAYRRCKEATQELAELERDQAARSTRQLRESIPEDPDEADGIELANCDPGMLYGLWESILVRINGLGPRTVISDDQPIERRITELIDRLRASGEARLGWLFAAEPNRIGRVGILMATLECVRQRFFEATQHEQYGEVYLKVQDGARAEAPPALEAAEDDVRKRRRRPPLATYTAAVDLEESAEDQGDHAIEEVLESDEQRFLRELEEACAVESVIKRVADIETSFGAFLADRRSAVATAPTAPPADP
jgi:segregation and condensation protein A